MWNKNSLKWAILGIVIMIAFYLLDRFNLLTCDDLRYGFDIQTWNPITSLSDAIHSQIFAYQTENGRFIVHVIVQYLLGALGMEWSRMLNSVFFLLTVLSCYWLVRDQCWSGRWLIPLVILSLIICIPVAGVSYLGNISLAVNYLWSSAIYLLFLLLFYSSGCVSVRNLWQKLLIIVFGLLCGAWQESFSIGICVGLGVHAVIHYRQLSYKQRALIIAHWLGAAFLVLAPGNFVRQSGWYEDVGDLPHRLLFGFCYVPVYCKVFDCWVIVWLFSAWKDVKKCMSLTRKHILLIAAILTNIVFLAVVALTGPHQVVCIELFSLLLLFFWSKAYLSSFVLTHKHIMSVSSIVAIVLLYIPIYYYRSVVHDAYVEMIESAKLSEDGTLVGGRFDEISFSHRNWFVKNFTSTERNQGTILGWLSRYLTDGESDTFLQTRLPLRKEQIVEYCNAKNLFADCVYHKEGDFFYVIINDASTNDRVLEVTAKNNPLSKLRCVLMGWPVSERTDQISLLDLYSFVEGGIRYSILYDNEEYPIVSIL